jgi:signal transduction histidine kinase
LPSAQTVQFYDDPEFLHRIAAEVLAEGLRAGEPALAIADARGQAAIADYLANLEFDVDALRACGDLHILDSADMLSRFMVDGMPDQRLLRAAIAGPIRAMVERRPHARIRAYGEMVDQLWREGNREAAVRLERLWNVFRAELPVSLMCGYRMKGFHGQSHAIAFDDVCAEHDCVLPVETYEPGASDREHLREVSRLQQRAGTLEVEARQRRELQGALEHAVAQRRQAQSLLGDAARIRDEFLAAATRELGGPLQIVHLQLLGIVQAAEQGRQALSPELISYRLRHAAEEVRRLSSRLSTLVDIARLKAGALALHLEEGCLAGIVKDLVDQASASLHQAGIVTRLIGVAGRWDGERIRQALEPLLDGATRQGGEGPVEVSLEANATTATIEVMTPGTGPDIEERDSLSDPGRMSRPDLAESGLAFWISGQLVQAMGGNIAVRSRAGAGSSVLVTLPRRLPA